MRVHEGFCKASRVPNMDSTYLTGSFRRVAHVLEVGGFKEWGGPRASIVIKSIISELKRRPEERIISSPLMTPHSEGGFPWP